MKNSAYLFCFWGVLKRELQRSVQQRTRFISALVRPLLWLAVFAAGFRGTLDEQVIALYGSPVNYEVYIAPGLIGMIILFNSMQSSLSMVYDREMGSMRILLTSPLPRSYLLFCKLLAIALTSLLQVYAFLIVTFFFDVAPPALGYLTALPAILMGAFILGALGLLLASLIEQLENFAGVMNFVVFPLFFLSPALYPLNFMQDANTWVYWACVINPFTYVVELIRHALYLDLNTLALLVNLAAGTALTVGAVLGFDPARRMLYSGRPRGG